MGTKEKAAPGRGQRIKKGGSAERPEGTHEKPRFPPKYIIAYSITNPCNISMGSDAAPEDRGKALTGVTLAYIISLPGTQE